MTLPLPQEIAPRHAELTSWQRMQVEAARKLVDDLNGVDTPQLQGPLGMLWLGRMEGAARTLLDILDAVVIP